MIELSGFLVLVTDLTREATLNSLTSNSNVFPAVRQMLDVKVTITPLHIAVLDRPILEILPAMEYQRRVFEQEGPLGWMESEQIEMHYKLDFRGRPAFPAGLLGRVRKALMQCGYRVVVDDQRTCAMPVNPNVLARLKGRDKALIRAMFRHPLGRIEVALDERATRTFSMLDEAFPDTRFVVATASAERAVTIWNQVHGVVTEKTGLAVPGRRFAGDRWIVGIPWKLATKIEPTSVLLLPDAEESVGDQVIDWVIRMGFQRCYAFVRPGRQYDRHVQLRLEQLAGPLIHCVAHPRVPVHVAARKFTALLAQQLSQEVRRRDSATVKSVRGWLFALARNIRHVLLNPDQPVVPFEHAT